MATNAAQAAEAAGFDRLGVSDHYHPWMSQQDSSPFVWSGEALSEHILGDAWPPVSVRQERLAEAIDVIRQLWTGEVVTRQGRYFTVHDARLFTLPQAPPDILVSAFGPQSTELAAGIGDGLITVTPEAEVMKAYRDAGGTGRTQCGMKICWAQTEKEARETAHHLWGHEAGGGQLSQDAPMWLQYAAIAELASPDDISGSVPCGPDPARAAEEISKYAAMGFDEIEIAQTGSDQEGGIRFLAEEVLPLIRG